MTIAGLLLVSVLVFLGGCLVIAARRGLWLKVEIDESREPGTRTVAHRHVHRHMHYHQVAHYHQHVHEVAHHHYLHPHQALSEPARPAARVGFLARAVLPRTPIEPVVDHRLIQHTYDPKENT